MITLVGHVAITNAAGDPMTWFRVDDGFWSHPKTLALSKSAVALWVRAGSYCGNHLTDGVVKRDVLPILQGTTDDANELINAGLWMAHVQGYVFHDWDVYQFTREKIEHERERTRQRVERHRASSQDKTSLRKNSSPVKRVGNAVGNAVTQFDDFWSVYPRKVGKGHARNAWEKAITKTDPSVIINGAQKYRDDKHRDPQFTAHPSTWLNGERWDDQPTEIKPSGPVTIMDQYTEPCEHGDPRGKNRCALCRKAANL